MHNFLKLNFQLLSLIIFIEFNLNSHDVNFQPCILIICNWNKVTMTFSSLSKIRLLYNKSQQKVQKKKSCPNGEFGWVIVITSLLITIILDGYAYTCGQFYEQFLLIYGHNQAITSLYISIMNGTIYCIST